MSETVSKPKVKTFFPQKPDPNACLALHVKMLAAEVKLEKESKGNLSTLPIAMAARFILNDFSEKGVVFFCTRTIQPGTAVGFSLDEPIPLQLKGTVRWCRETRGSGRVLTEQYYPHRIAVSFEFPEDATAKAEMEKMLQEYLAKVRTTYLALQTYE